MDLSFLTAALSLWWFCPLWSAIGDKTRRLCLTNILRLGRDIVSVMLRIRRKSCYSQRLEFFNLKTKLGSFLVYRSGLSPWNAATWTGIVKRQFIVLLSPSGTLSHGLILSKGRIMPCSVLVARCHTFS